MPNIVGGSQHHPAYLGNQEEVNQNPREHVIGNNWYRIEGEGSIYFYVMVENINGETRQLEPKFYPQAIKDKVEALKKEYEENQRKILSFFDSEPLTNDDINGPIEIYTFEVVWPEHYCWGTDQLMLFAHSEKEGRNIAKKAVLEQFGNHHAKEAVKTFRFVEKKPIEAGILPINYRGPRG